MLLFLHVTDHPQLTGDHLHSVVDVVLYETDRHHLGNVPPLLETVPPRVETGTDTHRLERVDERWREETGSLEISERITLLKSYREAGGSIDMMRMR